MLILTRQVCVIRCQGDKTLDGYQKKKYVCKLLFIFLLGHDIDFGHMEAVNLLSSNKYTEKQIVSHHTVVFEDFFALDILFVSLLKLTKLDNGHLKVIFCSKLLMTLIVI